MRRFALVACVLHFACFTEADVMGTESDGATGCTLPDGCDSTGTGMTTTESGSSSSPVPGTTAEESTGSTGPSDDTTGSPSESGIETDASTGPEAICGDGMVDPATEMCDSTPGCLEDCTFDSYDCNPLTNAGCAPNLRCGLFDARTEDFSCMVPGDGQLGAECVGNPANDGQCADGLTCLFYFNTPLCDEGNCCVEYCDLLDADFACSGGAECRAFFPEPMFLGLEHLGFCGEPF